MATFGLYVQAGRGVDMLRFGAETIFDYEVGRYRANSFLVYNDSDNYIDIGGSGFRYDTRNGGRVYGVDAGRVDSWENVSGGRYRLSISDLDLRAKPFFDAIFAENNTRVVSILMSGNDRIFGTRAPDYIYGGDGGDRLEGNGGADAFVFKQASESTARAMDVILDFSQREQDVIDLSRVDADRARLGNQDFDFIGGRAFGGDAGEVRTYRQHGDTFVKADVDGDRIADLVVRLDDAVRLTADDFIL